MEKQIETNGATLFEAMPLDENQQATAKAIRVGAAELFKIINEIKDGRCKSLAITNLEQSVMWANKGISRG